MKNSKPIVYALLFIALLALLVSSPAEATLGNVVKIVYAHGAAERVSSYAYLIAGVLGLTSLSLRGARPERSAAESKDRATKQSSSRQSDAHAASQTPLATLAPHAAVAKFSHSHAGVTLARWTQAVAETAIVFWIAQFVISAPAQILAWGAFTLNEPRVAGAIWILLLTSLTYIVARWFSEENSFWVSLAAIANAAIYVTVLRGEVNILHPFDPILGSDSLAIKVFYAAIVLIMGFIAFQFSYDRAVRTVA